MPGNIPEIDLGPCVNEEAMSLRRNYCSSILGELVVSGVPNKQLANIFNTDQPTIKKWRLKEPMDQPEHRFIASRLGALMDFMEDNLVIEPEGRRTFLAYEADKLLSAIDKEPPGLPRLEQRLVNAFPKQYRRHVLRRSKK